jgi:outer membrane protein TolC
MTLEVAIRIGLENSEVVRVIALGAQGIPVSGFEPVPLNSGAGGALGTGTLATVYDPAIQETRIADALAAFDAQLNVTANFARSTVPVNNSFAAGIFSRADRTPFISVNEGFATGFGVGSAAAPFGGATPTFGADLSKRTATGATLGVAHNLFWNYTNSPNNVYPSVWNTQTLLRFSQPLLGGTPQNPSGLEANRAGIVIQRLNADLSVWRFKSEVQALVRSVEQQYWVLAQQYVQLWASETAFDLSQKLLEDVLAKQVVGSRQGSRRDLADAQLQVTAAEVQFIQSTADVLTTERQLRNILGLPPNDNRRIVPVTEPTDARLEPNWDASLAQMVSFQPDIVQQQLLVRVSEMQLLLARNQLLPLLDFNLLYQFNGFGQSLDEAEAVGSGSLLKAFDPLLLTRQQASGLNGAPGEYRNFQSWRVGLTFSMPLGFRRQMADVRQAQYALLRQRAFLQQTVHQQAHALSRFFLEVDSNYKLYRAAQRQKEAAWVRLDYNKARYEVGDRDPTRSAEAVSIQQYIDSVNQWTSAVAAEARYKSTYNTSLAVLEESKGTLLGYDNVAIAEGPWPRKAYIQARDQQRAHFQHPVGGDGAYQPRPLTGPATIAPIAPLPPPDLPPDGNRPALPAPAGPLSPAPNTLPPQAPAGLPGQVISGRPAMPDGGMAFQPRTDASLTRASAMTGPAPAPAAMAPPRELALPPLPPAEPGVGTLPPIHLPPLPRE